MMIFNSFVGSTAKSCVIKSYRPHVCCIQPSLLAMLFSRANPCAAFHDHLAMLLRLKYLYMLHAKTPNIRIRPEANMIVRLFAVLGSLSGSGLAFHNDFGDPLGVFLALLLLGPGLLGMQMSILVDSCQISPSETTLTGRFNIDVCLLPG